MAKFYGRDEELAVLHEMFVGARPGHGGALTVCGEPGIGKTALLDHALATAGDHVYVLRASGSEFETGFAFATLHQLCVPLLTAQKDPGDAHRRLLRTAFGLRDGLPPEAASVATAVAGLAATVAGNRPVVFLVDDAQWSDPASARVLGLIASRAEANGVILLLITRDPAEPPLSAPMPRLTLTGLSDQHSRSLLRTEFRAPLDERVRARVLAEARGNPLALLELPRSVEPADLLDRSASHTSLTGRIEESIRERVGLLTDPVRLLLLAAATEPQGDPGLLRRAAGLLDVDHDAAVRAATMADFLDVDGYVRFRHPLVRSAVYQAAVPDDRRRVHLALAEAMDCASDHDRVAWHRAQAATGPDEGLAGALERSASRARTRAGSAAAAAFLARAAALSPDQGQQAVRALAAAEAKAEAGDWDTALDLLATAEAGPLDASQHARAHLARTRIAASMLPRSEAALLFVGMARRTASTAPRLARECCVDALGLALIAGRGSDALEQALAAATSVPRPIAPASASDAFLDALTTWLGGGSEKRLGALRALLREPESGIGARWPALSALLLTELWDWDVLLTTARRQAAAARQSGSFAALSQVLTVLALGTAFSGDTATAGELVRETEALAEATDTPPLRHAHLYLTALRGETAACETLTATADRAGKAGEGLLSATAWWCTALLRNSTGDFPAALAAARTAVSAGELGVTCLALPELVEAAVRCGATHEAEAAVAELAARTGVAPTRVGRGVERLARALVTDGPQAEEHYAEALSCLAGTSAYVPTARTHLLYGQWLRRQGRRQDARAHLGTASEMFSGIGARAFASHAAAEVRATGVVAVRRGAGNEPDRLTHQEAHVARLAGSGSTSKEIGMRLHLSPRTVDAHLRSIFRKLGITSRRQLRDMFTEGSEPRRAQTPTK
ncbi:AAA family ATPase [Streptomyces olivaceoviridis]|uniref:helix-turn-helix transcriptional regulator n=1 Tax=Streptomyces olivaceoviridis TaxID=1921 RepID=UPI0036C9FA17